MNIYEAMNYIESFSHSGKAVNDLSRFEKIMDLLGNPQNDLKIIHVAGTNGKGSTVRMLEKVFMGAGYSVGSFMSPYVKTYNDRIRINGIDISDDELAEIVTQIKPILDGIFFEMEEVSQFEITTAIAFIYFAALKCDIVILEAGLGGLLDCTNIIKKPVLSIITSVSFDHTKILGKTMREIAIQKAGIIKQYCPVILSVNQHKVTESVVRLKAKELCSEYIRPHKKIKVISCNEKGSKFYYKGRKYELSMLGKTQLENAVTVITAVNYLKKEIYTNIKHKHLFNGIKEAALPLRCQKLSEEPLILLDGAHNPDAMKKLADYIRLFPYEPKIMVCGMVEDKDYETSIGYISRYIDYAFCVDGFTKNTVSASKLKTLFREAETATMKDGLQRAIMRADKKGMVIIAGSLYLGSAYQKYL